MQHMEYHTPSLQAKQTQMILCKMSSNIHHTVHKVHRYIPFSYTHACILYFQDFCILFLLGFFYILLHLQQYANMHLAVFSKFLQICPPNPKFLFPEITFPLSQIGKHHYFSVYTSLAVQYKMEYIKL